MAAAIIYLVWRNRQKYLRLVALLTSQINVIPDQSMYDRLTNNIKQRAIETGVEPYLRKVLKDNGMLGTTEWQVDEAKAKSN